VLYYLGVGEIRLKSFLLVPSPPHIMQTTFSARSFFAPNVLPGTDGREGLSILPVLIIDTANQKIEIIQLFGAPTDLVPGSYNFTCDIRAKADKPGSNFWLRSCEAHGK